MTAPYYSIITNIGAAKLANATATDTPLSITKMGVGDANGTTPTPDPGQTSLIHECRRADLNTLKIDPNNPNQIIAEQVIPDNVGGWYIRELGLYDADGDLIAVGNCPPSYKPLIEEGASREQVIRMILIVTSDNAVTLKIDPAVVLATREYVDDSIEAHAKSRNHPDATTKAKGFVQLSSDTDSDDETKAATPKAVKAVKATADAAVKTVNSEKPGADGNVKLGSAADADTVTSMTDITARRVTVVGWMGTGGPEIPIPDGTDIYKYFVTAASGNYGGGGNLVNKATSSSWISFKWQQHGSDKRYGVLLEQSSSGQMALHIYNNANGDMTSPEKYWSNSGLFFSVKNPPTAAQTDALPVAGGTMSGQITLSGTGAGAWADQNNKGAPLFQLIDTAATSEYWPVFKQHYEQGDSTWSGGMLVNEGDFHLHYLNKDGTTANFAFRKDGQFLPQNYANFDNRYLPLTGGKLTGNLEINDAAPIIQLTESDTGKKFFIVADGGNLRINEDSTVGNAILSYAGASKQMHTVGQFVPGDWTNFDARYNTKYATGHRVGARTKISGLSGVGDWASKIPQGAVNIASLTEGNDRITDVYYAYLQYNLNGNWVNFA
ncbi:TPA: phage tail protein [Enterobacter ludwigii]|nr:phage tail protein [Enterobacter ludwigii]HDR2591084.1 phage tail protein [Enterobacter ludwigii]HDR2598721.1 phage tail protein [Enterobacter ludwigii]